MIKQKRPDGLVCYIVTQVYEHIQLFDTIRKKMKYFTHRENNISMYIKLGDRVHSFKKSLVLIMSNLCTK